MTCLSCCNFLQLDVQLHDRRKISGQLEYPFQCRDFRFQNENAARYFLEFLAIDLGFLVIKLMRHGLKTIQSLKFLFIRAPICSNKYIIKLSTLSDIRYVNEIL